MVVTTGAVRRAKIQSNRHQQTYTQLFYRLDVTQPTASEHWREKTPHFTDLLTSNSLGFFRPCLWPLKDYPGRRVANPLISLQHPAYSISSHFSTTAYGSRQPFSVFVCCYKTTHLQTLDGLVWFITISAQTGYIVLQEYEIIISRRAGAQDKYTFKQSNNTLNQENHKTLRPGHCGDHPLTMVRLLQGSLSSQSLRKYWQLNHNNHDRTHANAK